MGEKKNGLTRWERKDATRRKIHKERNGFCCEEMSAKFERY